MLGICQRDPNYYPVLNEEDNLSNIPNTITSFWKEHVHEKFSGGGNCKTSFFLSQIHPTMYSDIFDVYLSRNLSRIFLMDFNPYHPKTDSLLFTYDELLERFNDIVTRTHSVGEVSDNAAANNVHDSDLFRVIDSPSHPDAVRNTPANQHNAVPFDILHLSTGKDMDTFRDTWEEVLRKASVNYSMNDTDDDEP